MSVAVARISLTFTALLVSAGLQQLPWVTCCSANYLGLQAVFPLGLEEFDWGKHGFKTYGWFRTNSLRYDSVSWAGGKKTFKCRFMVEGMDLDEAYAHLSLGLDLRAEHFRPSAPYTQVQESKMSPAARSTW